MTKNKTHYDTLGVNKDASPQDIKRNYRQRAYNAHPDKGGTQEEMAELNRAYTVLSDPQRKLLYDKTGADEDVNNDSQINSLIMEVFLNALRENAPSVLAYTRKQFEDGKTKLQTDKAKWLDLKKKLLKRRNKIRVTSTTEMNLFHALIDNQTKMMDENLAEIDSQLGGIAAALKKLEVYESDEKAIVMPEMATQRSGARFINLSDLSEGRW